MRYYKDPNVDAKILMRMLEGYNINERDA